MMLVTLVIMRMVVMTLVIIRMVVMMLVMVRMVVMRGDDVGAPPFLAVLASSLS